ncbi:MAG: hypothetical protein H6502_01410 [Candidatus Woesearchaeota archaeon]|nr:MAG: hypothetical protein H6502_01410 [Candidatus Woesearchaeota archaeon]
MKQTPNLLNRVLVAATTLGLSASLAFSQPEALADTGGEDFNMNPWPIAAHVSENSTGADSLAAPIEVAPEQAAPAVPALSTPALVNGVPKVLVNPESDDVRSLLQDGFGGVYTFEKGDLVSTVRLGQSLSMRKGLDVTLTGALANLSQDNLKELSAISKGVKFDWYRWQAIVAANPSSTVSGFVGDSLHTGNFVFNPNSPNYGPRAGETILLPALANVKPIYDYLSSHGISVAYVPLPPQADIDKVMEHNQWLAQHPENLAQEADSLEEGIEEVLRFKSGNGSIVLKIHTREAKQDSGYVTLDSLRADMAAWASSDLAYKLFATFAQSDSLFKQEFGGKLIARDEVAASLQDLSNAYMDSVATQLVDSLGIDSSAVGQTIVSQETLPLAQASIALEYVNRVALARQTWNNLRENELRAREEELARREQEQVQQARIDHVKINQGRSTIAERSGIPGVFSYARGLGSNPSDALVYSVPMLNKDGSFTLDARLGALNLARGEETSSSFHAENPRMVGGQEVLDTFDSESVYTSDASLLGPVAGLGLTWQATEKDALTAFGEVGYGFGSADNSLRETSLLTFGGYTEEDAAYSSENTSVSTGVSRIGAAYTRQVLRDLGLQLGVSTTHVLGSDDVSGKPNTQVTLGVAYTPGK